MTPRERTENALIIDIAEKIFVRCAAAEIIAGVGSGSAITVSTFVAIAAQSNTAAASFFNHMKLMHTEIDSPHD
jgi:hypothetical protein